MATANQCDEESGNDDYQAEYPDMMLELGVGGGGSIILGQYAVIRVPNWSVGRKWDIRIFFQISQNGERKCTESHLKKSPDLSHLGPF